MRSDTVYVYIYIYIIGRRILVRSLRFTSRSRASLIFVACLGFVAREIQPAPEMGSPKWLVAGVLEVAARTSPRTVWVLEMAARPNCSSLPWSTQGAGNGRSSLPRIAGVLEMAARNCLGVAGALEIAAWACIAPLPRGLEECCSTRLCFVHVYAWASHQYINKYIYIYICVAVRLNTW